MVTCSGRRASRFVGTLTSSDQPACSTSATMRLPGGRPDPSAADSTTTPAMSCPGRHCSMRALSSASSPRFTEKACTRTRASSPAGRGSSTLAIEAPAIVFTMAFMHSIRATEQVATQARFYRLTITNGDGWG
jgi:hypothetical protein